MAASAAVAMLHFDIAAQPLQRRRVVQPASDFARAVQLGNRAPISISSCGAAQTVITSGPCVDSHFGAKACPVNVLDHHDPSPGRSIWWLARISW